MKTTRSSYNRDKQLPVHAVCRNCQTKLEGPYCHRCGQNVFVGTKRSFSELAFNTLENMFAVDHKLLVTLKYLIFFPGKLTKEYINGRIVRYVHPSKLFWFISLLFFMLVTYNIKQQSANISKATDAITQQIAQQNQANGKVRKDPAQKVQQSSSESNETDFLSKLTKASKHIDIAGYVTTYSPYVTFLLIPFFAFLAFILYKERSYFYADYLAFALHFHSFVFILIGSYLGIQLLFPNLNIGGLIFFFIPVTYFLIASWVVFKPGIPALIGKSVLIFFTFGIAILSVLLAFLAFMIYMAIRFA